MALQLKNKVKEDSTDPSKAKKGKYKRKRNVFGKRLTRFGLIGAIIGLAVAFVTIKVVFTLSQNKIQSKIDNELAEVNKKIKDYRKYLEQNAEFKTIFKDIGDGLAISVYKRN